MTPSKKFVRGLKKNCLLQTKLYGAAQQLSGFPLTAVVQHIIELAQITHTVHTVLCDDMNQLHTIQIIWCNPVPVDITIYGPEDGRISPKYRKVQVYNL
jgi:hypothetical protein